MSKAKPDRHRQEEIRSRIPRMVHLVEEFVPKAFEGARSKRQEEVPPEWRTIVQAMVADVHNRADEAARWEDDPQSRLGFEWSMKIDRVSEMVEHLLRAVRRDLGFAEESETLASMVLVSKALLQLQLELRDGGTENGRRDLEVERCRVLRALATLTPRFDDLALKKFAALRVVERCTEYVVHTDEESLDKSIQAQRGMEGETSDAEREAKQRDWFVYELPLMHAVLCRSQLASIDLRFGKLDPLVLVEELGELESDTRGGKNGSGEGRVGPARVVALLALQCGALDYAQEDDEAYDDAVQRVRNNLLQTRSRIRKELRAFPGQNPEEPIDT